MSLPEYPHPLARLGRRTVLGVLAAGAATAVTGIGRAEARSAPVVTGTAPRTLAQPGTAGGIQRPGFAIDAVGVRWQDTATGGRIRFTDQHNNLGPWQDIPLGCPAGIGDTAASSGVASALIPADQAQAYEVDLPAGARTVALNTTDGPLLRSLPAIARQSQLAGCFYLSRAAWGADESLRFDQNGVELYPPTYWPVQTVTVHHTATGNNDPDPAARVRAIYRFHVEESFGDIGYHFLIDEAGRIYEGRWSGTDDIPGFNPAGLMVDAAHVGGYNAGNVGIALLGTFTDQLPTIPAQLSLILLLAAILDWHDIDPLATVNYVNPISGAARTVAAIPGHRDWVPTLCPGDQLANRLPTIRSTIAHLINHQLVTPQSQSDRMQGL